MIDSINKDGVLTNTRASGSSYLTNFQTLDCWTISLPKTEKYLNFEKVKRTVNKIKMCRKIMTYTAPIMIICGAILLLTVK